jgi:glucose/arabinose dehydrogenase
MNPANMKKNFASLIRQTLACMTLVASLSFSSAALSQGFDPAKVDWEKLSKIPMKDLFIKQFNKNCAGCHGDDLQGVTLGPPLVGVELRHGDSVKEIAASIASGFPQTGMPGWSETMSESEIWNLALYVAEKRQGTTILDKRDSIKLEIPQDIIETEKYNFRIEVIAEGLDALPFGIAPLPDGRILLTERLRGLRFINTDGTASPYIEGTPTVYDDTGMFLGQINGLGWMLDVALHPDYKKNGWIYLHYTDRCQDCNALSKKSGSPVSMNRVVRGRIEDGKWIDEQLIWEADKETYTNTSDLAAAGRLVFDKQKHLYISVGMKDVLDVMGVQDMDKPYGKIHRVNDDGSIPEDNPFLGQEGALPSIYSLGHRSSQGLALNRRTGDIWESEMGPRGGDELNRLVKGGNFGWPVFTTGVNYDGRPVDVAGKLGLTLTEEDAQFPVVDWTPAVAISNFLFYDAREFRKWKGDIIAGTLRATDLLRMEVKDNKVVHTEVLLKDLARFRDVAHGPKGELYLLLENKSGSMIVRLNKVR